jgi:hypothetical protein
MIKRTLQHLYRTGGLSLLLMGLMLAAFWMANTASASSPMQRLFAGPPPTMVNYQGTVHVDGSPFTGPGYFKFAIVDSATGDGSTNYWANDATGSGEPGTVVPLIVEGGLFNVLLGDTGLTGVSELLDDTVFSETDTYLRVWFSTNPGGPFEALEPNQRIASVPYALRAKYAESAPPGEGAVPAGAVMFFDLASCPEGWTEMADAQGRTLVGLPSSGTLGGTVGSALSDIEDRGHTHTVDPESFDSSAVGGHSHFVDPPSASTSSSGSHSHEVLSFDGSTWSAGSGTQIVTWASGGVASSSSASFRPLGRSFAGSWSSSTASSHSHSFNGPSTQSTDDGSHSHTIDVPDTNSSSALTSSTMPYLQLLACKKD